MSSERHYFVIPGLFHLSITDLDFITEGKYPNLSQFLRFSKNRLTQTTHLDEVLCEQLEYSDKTVPLAHHFKKLDKVLISTPIRLKVDINSTWIQPGLHSKNTKKIIQDMADFFAEDLTLIDDCDNNFVIKFKKVQVVDYLPHYLTVLGKKIDLYQQSIRDNLAWFKLVNEIQMYLHGHALNKTDSGQPLFNSLWFWGGKSTQSLSHTKYIRSDDALLQMALSNNADYSQDRLIIKTDLVKYLKLNSQLELEAFFFQIDQELKGVNFNRISIDTADGQCLEYDQLAKFKFWKKRLNLKEILMQQYANTML